MKDFQTLVRPHISQLTPYSTARDEFKGEARLFLDANENPFDSGLNRYPDPLQRHLREKIATFMQVKPGNIFIGNGSDEAIDLLIRVFCEPNKDGIAYFVPTYGMYAVAAATNAISARALPLDEDFQPSIEVMAQLDENVKMLFLCNPNNPTGNVITADKLVQVLNAFHGIVVVDEAYIDFSDVPSAKSLLDQYQQLVVLQTFSKSWGLAAARMGVAMANGWIIHLLDKIKLPYNINALSARLLEEKLDQVDKYKRETSDIKSEREKLYNALMLVSSVEKVFPSEANFLLVRFKNGDKIYHHLLSKGIVVRNRSTQPGLQNCLRITVGTADQNLMLINELNTLVDE